MAEETIRQQLHRVFGAMFPLADDRDLPWTVDHLPGFLKDRIEHEVAQRVHWFQTRCVKVLCEISPPKTHVDDMCRLVVDTAKRSLLRVEELERQVTRLKKELADLSSAASPRG